MKPSIPTTRQPRFRAQAALAYAAVFVVVAGCSSRQEAADSAQAPATQQGHAKAARQLAYEHEIAIDTAPDRVASIHATGLAACRDAGAAACTLLESRIDSEPEASATLKFRARPDVIPKLVASMGQKADLARQSTRVVDLSGPIADSDRQLAMLEDYRSRLEALRSRAGNDVDALIKVNRELAEVQSSLEEANGKRAVLAQRVETEILGVSIHSDRQRPFWAPVKRAFAGFGKDLSQGIAIAISGMAYLLPWLVMLLLAVWTGRKLWRRRRRAG